MLSILVKSGFLPIPTGDNQELGSQQETQENPA